MRKYFALLLLPLIASCIQDKGAMGNIQGYAPVYQSIATVHKVTVGSPEATIHAGKIYVYKNFLFQVEQGKGIHVIDNSVPLQAGKIAFINIPGCSEIAIRSDYLYTNNVNDLVVLNLANVREPSLVSRQPDAFPQVAQHYPPFSNVYFECPDPERGVIVGWELKTLQNPKCRR